ncbi:sulfotransferase 1C4 [Nasonia vitripennis]|uniref:Sulfotransferase domain-containing protein n=1 Tax=Nasonia vitripennis TaxID=7425 RepID=A0A7M7QPZ9_NASVI|nr:sulfotransferase 1C4 [Nasonia vitripennis]XP_031780671.1 sulfotransferase 1C4 [Nasonia vitripennis]XP_032452291.1 sulfotransferase 1C4 [Nasonia vitripennis]XP_032452292.1 sulfotransferase 1C4 [Nasonia vitripennis]
MMDVNTQLPSIDYLDESTTKEMLADFKGEKLGWVLVGEKKWFLPAKYAKQCPLYYNFEVKPDDTWIVTFPRSGTTWTQELVWLLSNNLDFATAKSVPLVKRYPFLEFSMAINDVTSQNILKENRANSEIQSLVSNVEFTYETARSMPSPRFIKTHFPLSLVPNILKSDCKTIYVARNPKDVAVSYYHFHKTVKVYDYGGEFDKFWDYFQNDKTCWGPYWEHIKEAWAQRHNSNLLFLFYEEMTHDLLAVTKKVAKFLGKTYTDEQYKQLVDHLQFSNIKNNKMVNLSQNSLKVFFKTDEFIRQGKSQGWHKMFSPELNNKANLWIEDNLKSTDLRFPFTDIYS